MITTEHSGDTKNIQENDNNPKIIIIDILVFFLKPFDLRSYIYDLRANIYIYIAFSPWFGGGFYYLNNQRLDYLWPNIKTNYTLLIMCNMADPVWPKTGHQALLVSFHLKYNFRHSAPSTCCFCIMLIWTLPWNGIWKRSLSGVFMV